LHSRTDTIQPGRILVVDDQENLCWVLSRVLSERGHLVRTAQTSAQALRLASVFPCQVAIVDYRLPDGSGIAVIERLRAEVPGIRAILMTSYGSLALHEEIRSLGLHAFFDKPFVNGQMVDSVEAALLGGKSP
jgi:DNA-binding NtrC family response regulator